MVDPKRYREEHCALYWLWLDWKEKRKKKKTRGMIIVFGKETRAKLLDCVAFISQCRTQFEKDKVHPSVIKDCGELSDWLFKVAAGRMLRGRKKK